MYVKFKDVAKFYMGVDCVVKHPNGMEHENYCMLMSIPVSGTEWILFDFETGKEIFAFIENIKPVLRPLSSIDDKQLFELFSIYQHEKIEVKERHISEDGKSFVFKFTIPSEVPGDGGFRTLQYSFFTHPSETQWSISQFIYLIKNGFDIFGLIESGQAIDKADN